MKTVIRETLLKQHLFSELDDAALDALASHVLVREYPKGALLFQEGDAGETMMLLARGKVRISQVDNQEEEALAILSEGSLFGEMALLEALPRSATALAHTPVEVLEIHRRDFLAFLQAHPHGGVRVLLSLCRLLSSRLRETDVKLRAFVSLSRW